ncbi:MAG TPA: hypothetical protein VM328_13020 [Fimbriimonadaceae bacterium]|nr:hypothetical protein [Fimbriimonadaceae bacterium]
MSQAVVREADRQRLHDLFHKYGFTGTDAVTEEEIGQYIANWITSSRPTKQLKSAWAKTELRSRICEIAVAELEEWAKEIAISAEQGRQGSRLSLAASFRHDLLSRSIALWIGKEASLETTTLEAGGQAFQLGNSTFGSLATVEPRSEIGWSAVLLRGFDSKDGAGKHHCWSARAVVPLSRSEKGNYWTEVSRVTLGVQHVVLSRADPAVRKNVERALEEVAAPGYTVATATALPGLPPGWVLYENVRVLRALEDLKGFEAALSPVGITSGLQLVGGLRLGRGIWHEWAPPVAVVEAQEPGTTIRAWEGTSDEGQPKCHAEGGDGEARLNLGDCVAESGNLYLEASRGPEVLATSTLLLRSAAKARPLDRQLRGLLGYEQAISAAALHEASGPTVRGLAAPDAPGASAPLSVLPSFRELAAGNGSVEEQEEARPQPVSDVPRFDLATMPFAEQLRLPCAVRGFHHFRLDTVPPGFPKYAPVNMECKDCGISLLHRRKSKAKIPSPSRGKGAGEVVPASPARAKVEEAAKLPHDLWLDAAGFLGSGTMATFEGIVAQEELDPWRAQSLIRDLAWLAHVDLGLGERHRPKCWSVTPPVLAFIDREEAVLSGFRSRSFIEDIVELVATRGGSVHETKLHNQPALMRLTGLNAADARATLDVACDVHGRVLAIVEHAASKIAAFCLSNGSPFSVFRPMALGTEGEPQRYDVGQGRWRHVDSTSSPGAYKFTYAGTGYAFRGHDSCYSGPHELVKLAAARLEGVALHAYLEQERVFVSRLGCEPPGLLGRALVACSGKLPHVNEGTSRFENVPPDVAATVLATLYTGELPS